MVGNRGIIIRTIEADRLWLQGEVSGVIDADADHYDLEMWFPERQLPADLAPWTPSQDQLSDSELDEPSIDWWTRKLPYWKAYNVYP